MNQAPTSVDQTMMDYSFKHIDIEASSEVEPKWYEYCIDNMGTVSQKGKVRVEK